MATPTIRPVSFGRALVRASAIVNLVRKHDRPRRRAVVNNPTSEARATRKAQLENVSISARRR
jgi:hypothetical protein